MCVAGPTMMCCAEHPLRASRRRLLHHSGWATGDTGVVDVAAFYMGEETARDKMTVDFCLLFRGRPTKCFSVGDDTAPTLDSHTSRRVSYPNKDDNMHDALRFAPLTQPGASVGTTVSLNTGEFWELEYNRAEFIGQAVEMRALVRG